MDRIEYINELIESREFKSSKKQSIIVNNFFSLITIIIMSIAIILYVNYVIPAQKNKEAKIIKRLEQQQYSDIRAQRIALSHKMNTKIQNKENNETK